MLTLKWLDNEQIWERADQFRSKYDPGGDIPVPIDIIVDSRLKMNIRAEENLKSEMDIEGFLSSDFTEVVVDRLTHDDDRYYFRYRFTLAHEMGHFVLHRELYKEMGFKTSEDWKNFRKEVDEKVLNSYEFQANEFAGRLLVPYVHLQNEIEKIKPKIDKYKNMVEGKDIDKEILLPFLSLDLHRKFEVSDQVMLRRLRSENLDL